MKIGVCKLIPEPFRSQLVVASIEPIKGYVGEYKQDELKHSIKRIDDVRMMALNAHPHLFVDKKEEKLRARLVQLAELNVIVPIDKSFEECEEIRRKAGTMFLDKYIRDRGKK